MIFIHRPSPINSYLLFFKAKILYGGHHGTTKRRCIKFMIGFSLKFWFGKRWMILSEFNGFELRVR